MFVYTCRLLSVLLMLFASIYCWVTSLDNFYGRGLYFSCLRAKGFFDDIIIHYHFVLDS